jgi:hypothetical protein
LNLDPIYETDMAEGLKAMALEGHGLAFLPASSVRKELKAKRLVRAATGQHELTMEVRIYRERPERGASHQGRGAGPVGLPERGRSATRARRPAPAARSGFALGVHARRA